MFDFGDINNSSHKLEKVETIVKRAINKILLEDLEKPSDLFITINRLKLYGDYSKVIVYYTVLPENKLGTAKRFLNKHRKSVEYFLPKRSSLKRTPKVFFKYDNEEIENRKLDKLIDKALNDIEE